LHRIVVFLAVLGWFMSYIILKLTSKILQGLHKVSSCRPPFLYENKKYYTDVEATRASPRLDEASSSLS